MLDYRAWIIAAIILASAAGAYLAWMHRARLDTRSRSLSAASHPSKVVTKTLHVDGCNDDFIIKPGELVEPRVVPGASLDRFTELYGKQTKQDQQTTTWDEYPYSITDGDYGPGNPSNSVDLTVNQGHVVETLDGIELGIDSFGAIYRKMRDKKVEVHERIRHDIAQAGGSWTLTVSLYSACSHKYRSEYTRTLPASPDLDKLIAPIAPGQPGQTAPWHSDVFMNKVVTQYRLVPSGGHDDATTGATSDHN